MVCCKCVSISQRQLEAAVWAVVITIAFVNCRCISVCQGLQLCSHAQSCRQCGGLSHDRHGSHLRTCGCWGCGGPLPALSHRHHHHPQVSERPPRRCDEPLACWHVCLSSSFCLVAAQLPRMLCTLLCDHKLRLQATQRQVHVFYICILMVSCIVTHSNHQGCVLQCKQQQNKVATCECTSCVPLYM